METTDHKLSNMEQEMLKQLREALSDVLLPNHTDAVLLKFLREHHVLSVILNFTLLVPKTRNFNPNRSELLFRESLWARTVFRADIIASNYKKPEIIRKFEFTSYIGAAKDGTPLRYIAMGKGDFHGFIMSLSTYDIMAYCISVLEYDIQKAREQTEKTGKEINEISYILDFEHFSLQQCTYFCVVEIGLDLLRILQDYYPEIWKNILVVNAPFYFYQAFNLMRPILRHNLLQNIRVTSKEDTPGLLLKYVDPEVLPAFLGGKRVDSKGDPMCSEFVKYGGMVPEEYYACNRTYLRKKDLNTETILIAARSFYNYPVIVQKADSYIRIDLSVKSGSILTSLLYRPFDQDLERPNIPRTDERLDPHNEEHNIRLVSPPVRLQAHLVPISYNKFAAWPGIYIFKFDNTHSWLKSRRIDFNIRVESHCS